MSPSYHYRSIEALGPSDLVDKYGRPISSTREKDNLRRFYRLETEDQTSDGEPKLADYARGEVLLESSDEEDDVNVARDNDSDAEDIVTLGQDASKPISVREDEYDEIDLDESTFADLDAQAADYAKTHPEDQREGGERTRRIAVVNLDWDHVRAVHLYKIFSSLVSPTAPVTASSSSSHVHPDRQRYVKGGKSTVVRGNVLSLRVYTSEFGKERLAREETEGPPVEVFKGRKSVEDEEINEKNIYEVGGEDDYDEDALRKYQLERLRYVLSYYSASPQLTRIIDTTMRLLPVIQSILLRISIRNWMERNWNAQRMFLISALSQTKWNLMKLCASKHTFTLSEWPVFVSAATSGAKQRQTRVATTRVSTLSQM